MKTITLTKVEQIQTILAASLAGKDGFDKEHLPCGKTTKDFRFEDVFTITEADVHEYVIFHGWDERIVKRSDHLPDVRQAEIMFYHYIILPAIDDVYHLAHFGSFDRELWLRWEFDTEEEMFKFIIHELYRMQQGFWKNEAQND